MKTIIWSITHAHSPRSQVINPWYNDCSLWIHLPHPAIMFFMCDIFPIHGTLQVLAPSSNLSPPQASRGMREDEVL